MSEAEGVDVQALLERVKLLSEQVESRGFLVRQAREAAGRIMAATLKWPGWRPKTEAWYAEYEWLEREVKAARP